MKQIFRKRKMACPCEGKDSIIPEQVDVSFRLSFDPCDKHLTRSYQFAQLTSEEPRHRARLLRINRLLKMGFSESNCFHAVLYAMGLINHLDVVDPRTFIKKFITVTRPVDDWGQPWDVVLLWNRDEPTHAMILVNEKMVFHKTGIGKEQPYLLSFCKCILDLCPKDRDMTIHRCA
jgi:hypothetical protein